MTLALLAACVLLTRNELDEHDEGLATDPVTEETTTGDTGSATTDPDGTYEQATPIVPDPWVPGTPTQLAEDAIGFPGDHDFYALELAEGDIVLVWTEAFEPEEFPPCDTVVRLYELDGVVGLENDDLIYRLKDSDSGQYWQAAGDGPLVIEVLEWNEWTGAEPIGGPDCDYELWAAPMPVTEIADNDEVALVSGSPDDGLVGSFFTSTRSEFVGEIEPAADVDLYPVDVDQGEVVLLSLWPGNRGLDGLRLRLLDGTGAVLAETALPEWHYFFPPIVPSARLMWAAPITTQVYCEVTAAERTGPPMYAGMGYTNVAGYWDPESEPNQLPTNPNTVAWTVGDPGEYSAHFSGMVTGVDPDDYLISESDVVDFAGKYLSAIVQARSVGAGRPLRVRILDDDGATVLAESTIDLEGLDPMVLDFRLPDTAGSADQAYVEIVPEGLGVGVPSYFLTLTVFPHLL